MSGSPATRCRTLGSADFMRVPFPAARMTTCVSMSGRSRPLQLSRRTRLDGTPAIRTGDRRRFERRPKCIICAERLEIGIGTGEGSVFWVQGNCPLEMCDRLCVLLALRVRDRQHVQSVVVV